MTRKAEIVIVGGGPAGAALALRLARAGRDVLLLERSRFPRDKPCGDCVNPGAVSELELLGVAERLRVAARPRPLAGWRVESPDGRAFQARFAIGDAEVTPVAWAIRRRDFDHALIDLAREAGASVEFGARVYDLSYRDGRVNGVVVRRGTRTAEIGAALVVGADGLRSVVRRRLGVTSRPPRLRKLALVAHTAGGPVEEGGAEFGELRVANDRVCGFAPLAGDAANATLVVPGSEAARLAGDPRSYLIEALREFPVVYQRVRTWGLERDVLVTGPFDVPVSRVCAPGALLVGDAAGYYDPFTGQGIHQALRGARLAAEVAGAVLERPSTERLAMWWYEIGMRRVFEPKRALQKLIEHAIQRPRLLSRAVGALGAQPSTSASRLLRAVGDLTTPLALGDPVFLFRFLAAMRQVTA